MDHTDNNYFKTFTFIFRFSLEALNLNSLEREFSKIRNSQVKLRIARKITKGNNKLLLCSSNNDKSEQKKVMKEISSFGQNLLSASFTELSCL